MITKNTGIKLNECNEKSTTRGTYDLFILHVCKNFENTDILSVTEFSFEIMRHVCPTSFVMETKLI